MISALLGDSRHVVCSSFHCLVLMSYFTCYNNGMKHHDWQMSPAHDWVGLCVCGTSIS